MSFGQAANRPSEAAADVAGVSSQEAMKARLLQENDQADQQTVQLPANSTEYLEKEEESRQTTTIVMMEKPKRPLSAYNMFFRDQRELLLQSLPDRKDETTKPKKSHGKLNFKDMAQTIAARWKTIDPLEKKQYEDIAAKGRAEYKARAKQWRKQKDLGLVPDWSSSSAASAGQQQGASKSSTQKKRKQGKVIQTIPSFLAKRSEITVLKAPPHPVAESWDFQHGVAGANRNHASHHQGAAVGTSTMQLVPPVNPSRPADFSAFAPSQGRLMMRATSATTTSTRTFSDHYGGSRQFSGYHRQVNPPSSDASQVFLSSSQLGGHRQGRLFQHQQQQAPAFQQSSEFPFPARQNMASSQDEDPLLTTGNSMFTQHCNTYNDWSSSSPMLSMNDNMFDTKSNRNNSYNNSFGQQQRHHLHQTDAMMPSSSSASVAAFQEDSEEAYATVLQPLPFDASPLAPAQSTMHRNPKGDHMVDSGSDNRRGSLCQEVFGEDDYCY